MTMKRLLILALGCLVLASCGSESGSQERIAVVPRPSSVAAGEGGFRLEPCTPLYLRAADSLSCAAAAFDELVHALFGASLPLSQGDSLRAGSVALLRADSLREDAYRLTVEPGRLTIAAGGDRGAFYAVQTLRQLIPAGRFLDRATGETTAGISIPAVRIDDAPALAYRGLMLDVARHFFTVEEVKRTLDLMALHKLNVFHWHLTDDQGWRIEIRKYPKLTEIGSVRRRTLIGHDPGGEYDETCRYDETPHGGYYTQAEIREVVDYAARRFITVIPEVEFPGHAVAALASYPWLGCTGEQYEVRQTWDIDDRVFCVGRDTTFDFIEGVLDEVLELFPSPLIHIGGDECPDKMWARCPHCRERMRREGLTSERQLQGYATARVERYLAARGRRLMGWDEILDGGVSPTAVVMSWRGSEGGIRAARQGNPVVMAPTTHCYLDYYQTADTSREPLAWGGCLPLEKVYALDPYEGLDARERANVLGVQANLWTEYIADFAQVQYMLLPRLAAVAERGWCPAENDFADFRRRLRHLTGYYDALGYRRAPHGTDD